MKNPSLLSLEKARAIAQRIATYRERWGRYSPMVDRDQLQDVILVLEKHGAWGNPTNDDLTKVKRQLTASLAREAKLKKQLAALGAAVDSEDKDAET